MVHEYDVEGPVLAYLAMAIAIAMMLAA